MKQFDFLEALNGLPEEYAKELTEWQQNRTPLPDAQENRQATESCVQEETVTVKKQKHNDISVKWLRPVTAVIFSGIAACLVLGLYFGIKAHNSANSQPQTTPAAEIAEQTGNAPAKIVIPDVCGTDFPKAYDLLKKAGYTGASFEETCEAYLEPVIGDGAVGTVKGTIPPPGSEIDPNKPVVFQVSMPNAVPTDDIAAAFISWGFSPELADSYAKMLKKHNPDMKTVMQVTTAKTTADVTATETTRTTAASTATLPAVTVPQDCPAGSLSFSTAVLAAENRWVPCKEEWVENAAETEAKWRSLIGGFTAEEVTDWQTQFDFDGGGFMLRITDGDTAVIYELFGNGLYKRITEDESGTHTAYLRDSSGNEIKLVWAIQEQFTSHNYQWSNFANTFQVTE